jgi:hypothetical protein
MCSQYKTGSYDEQTHTIHHYVLRKKGGLYRGAYALASAYPSTEDKKNDSLLTVLNAAQRLKISTKKIQRVQGTITDDKTDKKRESINKNKKKAKKVKDAPDKEKTGTEKAKYQPSNENGAYTVDSLLEFWGSTDQEKLRVVTHDARTARVLGKLGVNTSDGEGREPIEFDTSKYHMIQFHHTLRGITFTRDDNVPDKINPGDVHLDYRDAKKRVLESTDIYKDISTAYYDGAHRIQCRGQLRFECYRVKGPDVKRVFVGTPAEYAWFIDMLVGARACQKDDTSDEKVTPMMIEMLVRRSLLMAVNVEFGSSHKELNDYIDAAMSEWGASYTGTLGADTEITVSTSYTDRNTKKKTEIVQKIEESDLVSKPELQTHKAIRSSFHPGTLLVFANDVDYNHDAVKGTEQINVHAHVLDIRGRGACRSMLKDKCTVRCAIAIFVGVDESSLSWFDVTRVAADKYYKCALVSDLKLPRSEEQSTKK